MAKSLFDEFNPVSAKAWKQKIQLDLKGADYNNTLIWKSSEGIDVKPFYHSEDFKSISHHIEMPSSWYITESIYVHNEIQANKKANYLLSKGAENLKFIIPNNEFSLKAILENIDLSSTPIYLDLEFLDAVFIKQNINNSIKTKIHTNTDIIGNLVKTGNWYSNLNEDHKNFEEITKHTNSFSVNLLTYQNAGANMVQQLAYTLAHTNEYLNHIHNTSTLREFFEENSNETLNININVSVGTNYFFEIAKLKALLT